MASQSTISRFFRLFNSQIKDFNNLRNQKPYIFITNFDH